MDSIWPDYEIMEQRQLASPINDDDVYVVSPAGHILRHFGASDPLGRKMRLMPPADGTRVVKGLQLKRMVADGEIRS